MKASDQMIGSATAGRGGDSGIRGSGGVCGHTIGDVLVGAGSGNESVVLGALELVKEANNNNLGRVLEVTDGIGIGKLDSWWACGLADVADNGVVGAAALVLCGSAALEELQGREGAHIVLHRHGAKIRRRGVSPDE